jgi:hypothetical protein
MKKISKFFCLLSIAFFIAVNVPLIAIFYDDMRFNGTYCQRNVDPLAYNIKHPFIETCFFDFSALSEPLFIFLLAHSIVQTIIGVVYGLVWFVHKNRNEDIKNLFLKAAKR